MSRRFDLTVEPRTTGKHFSRASRNEKKVPAVVYGSIANSNILIDEKALVKFNTRAYENALFSLKSDDSKLNGVVTLLKSVQVHPLTRRPLHVDLFALDLKKQVRVNIEIRFEGKPLGIADGGLLNIVNRQIEIECLPTEIPESITIDISDLGVGDAKHVSDLKLPTTVKLISSPDTTLAVVNMFEEETVVAPTADAAAAPAAAAPAAGAAAPAKAAEAKPAAKK
jgi:large subunit ribosomal protein L25